MVVRIRRLRIGGAVRSDVEELTRRCSGIVPSEIKVLMLNRLMRSDRVRVDRIAGLRAMLLLHPLLLLLLLLIYRGPAQPDTTRATGQSTEGRGGQLLGLLLLTSSVSIPGELQLRLLLMLRSLLLLILSSLAGRLRTE